MVSRFEISADMSANGAQRVRAQDIPTTPTSVVACRVLWTNNVAHMVAAKSMWDKSQARRSVSQWMTSLERIGWRGAFLFRQLGATKKGRKILDENEVMANIRSAKVPTRVAFSQSWSICSFVRSGFWSRNGVTS